MDPRASPTLADRASSTRRSGARARRWLRSHAVAYALGIGTLTAINVAGGAPWWALWPTLGWGLALMVHVLIVKAMTIDEHWVDQRASELREKSYDFDHIQDIERRIIERDFSVEPPAEANGHGTVDRSR